MHGSKTISPPSRENRGRFLHKWSITLRWDNSEVAKRVGVSTRMISAIKSGAQDMKDSRWRLFVHEALSEIHKMPNPEIVVVVTETQEPLDFVSSDNYAGIALSDDGKTGIIASYSTDRLSGAPEVHRQFFPVEPNKHLFAACDRWEAARREDYGNSVALQMNRWLMTSILKGELNNPELIDLKAAIREVSDELRRAVDAPEEERQRLAKKRDVAVARLIEAVAKAEN